MTMRKIVTKKIGERTLTLRELTVEEIRNLMDMAARLDDEEEKTGGREKKGAKKKKTAADQLLELPDLLQELVRLGCADDLTVAELEKWTPGAIRALWEGFKEANAAFFEGVERLGVAGLLQGAIKQRLSAAYALLSSAGI